MPLTDTDLMPWGKYKDWKMEDIPASYLIWLYDNKKCSGDVLMYIQENIETLRLEVKQGI